MKTCPRCAAQVEVYNTACACGFAWVPPGEYRTEAIVEQSKQASIWPPIVGILLLVVGAWHVYCTEKLEASIYEYIRTHVRESPVNAAIEINVQPITNLVAIELKAMSKDSPATDESENLRRDAALAYVRGEVEPYFERELTVIARRQVDIYAMALPYRIAFSLEVISK